MSTAVALYVGWVLMVSAEAEGTAFLPMADREACMAGITQLEHRAFNNREVFCIHAGTGEVLQVR